MLNFLKKKVVLKKSVFLNRDDVLTALENIPSSYGESIEYRRGYNEAIFRIVKELSDLDQKEKFLSFETKNNE